MRHYKVMQGVDETERRMFISLSHSTGASGHLLNVSVERGRADKRK